MSRIKQMKYTIQLGIIIIMFLAACGDKYMSGVADHSLPDQVDFNFHVKPILSDRCFTCHGPDENGRKAELRLDLEETAFASLKSGGGKAIYPHNPSKSNLIKRIKSTDPEYQMPPPESNLKIDEYEIALIEKWIDQGAKWKKHWAFIPPQQANIPNSHTDLWSNMNDIDRFILEKANRENLKVKSEADRERLLRRVYMDITGLPPDVDDIDNFINDTSPDAYEKIVDQLLDSEAHAERLAMEWMDVARYADSHGLHADGWRHMHPWRDWVIKSFHENMTYDNFIKRQLAGDLLPDPSREDLIATAFNRNHMMTAEGGAIDEEWRLNYVFDRSETMSTALMGLTVGCAKCHDHKYDPISQKDYYQLASFFNNVKEAGMTGDDGNYGPVLFLTDKETQDKIDDLKKSISAKEAEASVGEEDLKKIKNYVSSLKNKVEPQGMIVHVPFERRLESLDKETKEVKVIFDGDENFVTRGDGKLVDGKYGNSLLFEKDFSTLYIAKTGQFEMTDEFSSSVWINTTQSIPGKTQTIIGNSGEKNNFWRGWDLYLDEDNRLNTRLISALPHNYLHIRSQEVVDTSVWTHAGMSYDGSGDATGLSLYINGSKSNSEILYNDLTKSIKTIATNHQPDDRALQVGVSGRLYTGEDGLFYGRIDDIKIFDIELTEYEMSIAAGLESELDADSKDLMAQRLGKKEVRNEIKDLRKQILELMIPVKEMMVMQELEKPNHMYIYHRGEYDKPTEEVTAGTPPAISDFPEALEKNRLGLTEWLFDKKHPLTARVAVNRYWQMIFGRGLVATPEDFGMQGALPSHPELLDWLAIDFIESGWNMRYLLKKMVMSATYRQSSVCTNEERQKDPNNIYLARGSSYRLPAEMIRDNALAASGLLEKKVGGASVRPYQPEGLWIEKGNFSRILLKYKTSKGDSLYRRSLYTFVKRTSPHPMMATFDAPSREVCTIKRENTNTPLQALVLMNDPQFVEAANVMAQRMQIEGGNGIDKQISFAFSCATGRKPIAEEIDLLKNLYQDQMEEFAINEKDAKELLDVGEYMINEDLDHIKTAALAMVCNTILNHDDTYMKR